MAIRMTDDQPDRPEQFNDNSGGRRGGGGSGGGGLFALIPLLIRIFGVKGVLIIGAIGFGAYFLLGREGCANISQAGGLLSTGGFLNPQEFQKTNIYESLEEDDTRNPLPEAVSLQRYAPPVGDQGQQGSCVAWSAAYAARTILESSRTNTNAAQLAFSPAFLYNQIGLDGCQGSYIKRAMDYMKDRGSVPYDQFPYTDQDCSRQPSGALLQEAAQFKMRGFNRLTKGNSEELDMRAIRENLAQGAPVVIGMMVGESFMKSMQGQDVWRAAPGDPSMMGFGGHAMCVVGYDDRQYGGSFLIMNSWGPDWGRNGFAWVRYPDFQHYVREAYALEPMAKTGSAANQPFKVEVGLVEVEYDGSKTTRKGYIPLKQMSANRFETTGPVRQGIRFKMEVKNTTECYTYVFGKETDGTSFTLFPYPNQNDPAKTRYSPFCGITGYRLFPKDKSMTPDSIGNRDVIAIVVSKKELDWYTLNAAISQQPTIDYASRVATALRQNAAGNIRYSHTNTGTIQLQGPASDDQLATCIVEISK